MQSLHTTPVVHAFPQLRRWYFLRAQNQGWVAAYLAHLRACHDASSTQAHALRALTCFTALIPAARQATLYQDLTQTTPADMDAWMAAACQQG